MDRRIRSIARDMWIILAAATLVLSACSHATGPTPTDGGKNMETPATSPPTGTTPSPADASPSPAGETPTPKVQESVAATPATVRFFGRTYADKDFHYFNWPASGFEFTFWGTRAEATFMTSETQKPERFPRLAVFVDGSLEPDAGTLLVIRPGVTDYVLAEGLPGGVHSIRVIKLSGNFIGGNINEDKSLTCTVGVGRLTCPDGRLLAPPAAPQRRLEFIGDSITVGMGILGEGGLEADDAWRTYAAYTARQFGADLQVLAISGMGLISSLFGGPFIQLPDEFPYTDNLNRPRMAWDPSAYVPQVVVVNLGTNDAAGVGDGKRFTPGSSRTPTWRFSWTSGTPIPASGSSAPWGPCPPAGCTCIPGSKTPWPGPTTRPGRPSPSPWN